MEGRTEGIAQLNKQNSLASSNLFSFSIHWREDKREKHRLFPSLPQKNDKSSSPSSLSSRVSLPPLPTSPVPPAYSSPLALLSDPLYSPISFLFPNFFPSVLGLSSLYCRFRHFSLRLRAGALFLPLNGMFPRKWENGSHGKASRCWDFLSHCSSFLSGYNLHFLLWIFKMLLHIYITDMHVYGESPMTDALQLVCCNTCKKPIKDSQFAAHAELCRSLKLTEQTMVELDTGNRKPPRKEKKKLGASSANQASAVGEQRRSESIDNIDSALSQSHLNSQIRVVPFSNEVTGYSSCVGAALIMDGTGIDAGNRDHSASVMYPPTKRHKLIANIHLPVLESHGTESGETKTVSFTDGITCNFLERTISQRGDPNHKNRGQVLVQHQGIMKNDSPAPLATKIYYSQRTNRLRARIRHLYFQDLNGQCCTDVVCPKTSHAEMVAFQDSSLRDPSFDQMDNVHEGRLPAQKSDHILAKSSEIGLLKAGGLPSSGLPNQFLDNVSRSAGTNGGLTRSNFLPTSYSFVSNTGNPLGTMQQPNGSVPVI
ncbi:hypothetical protein GmHk_13G038293 [Glycine max]|nr:hypothetical protein GmHk_13G038293 [Glycine max]